MDWDEAFYRFYSAEVGHLESTDSYRKGRELIIPDSKAELRESIKFEFYNLFHLIENETGRRPIVALLTLDIEKNYSLKFDYTNPRAMQIAPFYLGTKDTYFQNNEVDVPEFILRANQKLTENGKEMPIFYTKGQLDIPALFASFDAIEEDDKNNSHDTDSK